MLQSSNESSNWVKDSLGFITITPFERKMRKTGMLPKDRAVQSNVPKHCNGSNTSKWKDYLETRNLPRNQRRGREHQQSTAWPRNLCISITGHLLFISKCLEHLLLLQRYEASSVKVWSGGGRYLLAERQPGCWSSGTSFSWHLDLVIKPLPSGQLFTSV